MAHPAVPYRATLFSPPYRRRRVLHLGFSCQVAGGGGVLNGKLVGDQAMSHVPFHWLQLFCVKYFFWYFLSSSKYRAKKQTRVKALSLVLRSTKSFTSRKILFFVVWPKFSKFTRNACDMVLLSSSWCLLPNGKQSNWSTLKKKSLLVHKDIKIKINEMYNECFYLCKLEV